MQGVARLDRNQTAVAIALLNSFIHEVEAQAGKHIDKLTPITWWNPPER